jgi:hypothetical protein
VHDHDAPTVPHAHGRSAGQLRLSLIDHSTLNNEYFNLLVFGANIGKKEQSSVGLGVSTDVSPVTTLQRPPL